MPFIGDIEELRTRLSEMQGFPANENLSLEELSEQILLIIMETEIPKYSEVLRRLGES